MENNITIITQLSLDDQIRIDKLTTVLTRLAQCLEATGNLQTVTHDEVLIDEPDTVAETPQEAPEPVEQEQTPPEAETPQDEPAEAEEATPAPSVSKQDILQKVIALCGAGKKAEAKDIITTYADSVSDLPECALDEVWGKLIALEG